LRYYDYDTAAERFEYERELRAEQRAARRAKARKAARAKARRARARRLARAKRSDRAPEPRRMPAVTTYTRSNDDSRSNAANALQKKQPVAGVSAAPPRSAPESEANVAAKSSEPVEEAAQEAGRKQIADGYRLLRAGFVKKARERFELAMKSNAAEASLGQGRSLDPIYLKTVAFPDMIPDAEQARRMYRRAILLGNTEAKADLERLEQAMAADAPRSISPVSPAGAAPIQKQ
jgi:hypothetical protein